MKENEKQDVTGNENLETSNKKLFPIVGNVFIVHQTVMFMAKFYFGFVLTYRLAFSSIQVYLTESLYWVIIDEFMDLIFFFDIIITFNKPYYDSHNFIRTKRSEIASHYLKTWFFIDVCLLFPTSFLKYQSRNMKRNGNE